MKKSISRRAALRNIAGSAALVSSGAVASIGSAAEQPSTKMKGNINHSVCKWCYPKISLEELCRAGREIGLQSVELLVVDDFPVLQKHGMICAMVSGVPGGISSGLNRIENHQKIAEFFEQTIPLVAKAGFPNIICFSGNRRGQPDEQGLENCAIGLKKMVGVAEKHKVNICMELLNSKVDHADYQCDNTHWGVELCKRVGSDRFKLLYDIYHMQIMEGDVIRTIRNSHQYIAHYHTGGVPGRNEIDQTQELFYPAVMKAIVETGFKGFVAQEFIPKREPLASLRQGVQICDV
jgi:hydroxypyruvate isomerase